MRAYPLADQPASIAAPAHERAIHPEIQGLRAIAVLMVIAAHARLPGLGGGFIGVDVFFVLSGFLITRLLLAEMALTGRIDLIRFWARRARRLLPNAYATLLGTLLLALFLFPGYSPDALIREIKAAALEIANFHFARKAVDYFQADSPASPVLHFWSLAVEEQFYIVWPPLLLGIGLWFGGNVRRAVLIALGLIVAASFAASLWLTATEQPVAYFHTVARLWQLGIGALLAAGWSRIERLSLASRAALAWLGLAAILTGVALLGEARGYPGFWALLPTLGAAGLLAGFEGASRAGILRRGLSLPAMQWLGARSYSWYLWHWPLLALPRAAIPDSPYIEMAAVPVSLGIASAAYAWLENPVRQSRHLAAAPWGTLAVAAAGIAILIGAGQAYMPALLLLDKTVALREVQIKTASGDVSVAIKDGCHLSMRDQVDSADCIYGAVSAGRRAVLFGDSHADHWFPALNAAAMQTGWQLKAQTKSSCPSIDVPLYKKGNPYRGCQEWRDRTMAMLTGPNRPDLIIISNDLYYKDRIYDLDTGEILPRSQVSERLRQGFRKIIRKLTDAGVAILIIRDIPKANSGYESCLVAGGQCSVPRQQAFADAPIDADVAREFGDSVTFADFSDDICGATTCPIVSNGTIIYRNRGHLTATYAATFAPQMARLLRGFAEKRAAQEAAARKGDPRDPVTSALGREAATAPN